MSTLYHVVKLANIIYYKGNARLPEDDRCFELLPGFPAVLQRENWHELS